MKAFEGVGATTIGFVLGLQKCADNSQETGLRIRKQAQRLVKGSGHIYSIVWNYRRDLGLLRTCRGGDS